MNWKLVNKDSTRQPAGNNPDEWKEQIAEECYHQCVYCSIHEKPWGGIDHYHIDHYRPKSRPEFSHLRHDICNLFYACPVCNRFKSNDWPGDPADLNQICYPDPSRTDYSTLFEVDTVTYLLSGNFKSATYLINRLYLNRPQLVCERRGQLLRHEHSAVVEAITEILQRYDAASLTPDDRLLRNLLDLTNEIAKHLLRGESIRPYRLSDIRKKSA